MNDYMQALHRQFFMEPELEELREEIELLRLNLKEKMERSEREKLLRLVDLGIELQDEISLAAFKSGFQLAAGIASEIVPYSFEDEEERRAESLSRRK